MIDGSSPQISVVLPVYGESPYLEAAIASTLNQTYRDFELLVICDEPTDRTLEVTARISASDPRVSVIRNPSRLGLVHSLNLGCRRARGQFIARMDSDDVCHPHRFEIQVDYLRRHPEIGVVGARARLVTPSGRPIRCDPLPGSPNSIYWHLLFWNCVVHPTVMMRKEVLGTAGPYDPEAFLSEDLYLWLHLGKHTKIANLHEVVLDYRISSGSITQTNRHKGKEVITRFQLRTLGDYLGREITVEETMLFERLIQARPFVKGDRPEHLVGLIRSACTAFCTAHAVSSAEAEEIRTFVTELMVKIAVLSRSAGLRYAGGIFLDSCRYDWRAPFMMIRKGYHLYQDSTAFKG